MSITDIALIGVVVGLAIVFLALRLERKINPDRRHHKVWRHKTI
jgi:hypothetical protein